MVLTVNDIPNPPEGYDGNVDMDHFWNTVATEMLSRGLIPCKSCQKTEQLKNSWRESKV